MENLYEETLDILKENGKTENDVIWFGHVFLDYDDWEYPRDKFKELLDYEYDSGYGAPEADEYLYIVGNNWWLERHQYDGLEWWEYKTMPTRPVIMSDNFY